MANQQPPTSSATRKEAVDLSESVAGEEDPGASLDATQDSTGSAESAEAQANLRASTPAAPGLPDTRKGGGG